jgi:predicted AlkP superfamily pyrophosphatase or phosphodiesterase
MSNKVILVVIDGLGFRTCVDHCGYLESLVVSGKARRWTMEAVLPSLSAPIYETLHSGTEPHDHGITSNANIRLSSSDHVFAVARRHDRRTAAVAHYNFCELYNGAPYSPLEDHEFDDQARTIQHGRFYSQEGRSRHHLCVMSDADLMTKTSILVRRFAPDYLLVHSMSCDAVGHAYGGGSPEYELSAWGVDDQLAQHVALWREVGYRVLVTADHGMSADGHHGGTTEDVRKVAFYDIGHPDGGVAAERVSQLSVAPTSLSLMGLPVPAAMAGPPLAG